MMEEVAENVVDVSEDTGAEHGRNGSGPGEFVGGMTKRKQAVEIRRGALLKAEIDDDWCLGVFRLSVAQHDIKTRERARDESQLVVDALERKRDVKGEELNENVRQYIARKLSLMMKTDAYAGRRGEIWKYLHKNEMARVSHGSVNIHEGLREARVRDGKTPVYETARASLGDAGGLEKGKVVEWSGELKYENPKVNNGEIESEASQDVEADSSNTFDEAEGMQPESGIEAEKLGRLILEGDDGVRLELRLTKANTIKYRDELRKRSQQEGSSKVKFKVLLGVTEVNGNDVTYDLVSEPEELSPEENKKKIPN